MSTTTSYLRFMIMGLLALYLFVYPFGILLIALDIVPSWGIWMGGALLIMQGLMMGCWLVLNHGKRGLLAALSILLISWAVEHIGVTTGFPFGGYHYTETLNLKILGVVPLAVPCAWLLVVPASLGIAQRVLYRTGASAEAGLFNTWQQTASQSQQARPLAKVRTFLSHLLHDHHREHYTAVTQTADTSSVSSPLKTWFQTVLHSIVLALGAATFALLLDLMIEPLAVHINGYWVWDNTGEGYYGVPGSNFVAWWVTSLLLAAILVLLTRPINTSTTAPAAVPVYAWLPRLLYVLNLTMFVLIFLAHGKLLAVLIGLSLLVCLLLVRMERWLVRWIMGAERSKVA